METNSEMNTNRWVDHHLVKLNPDADWQPNTARAFARFEERRRPVSRRLTWAVAAVIAACICVLAFLASRTIVTQHPEKVSAAGVTLKEGQTPPDFKLPDATGASIRLSHYKGKVVLLNFWATWCHGCKTEIPWFMEFAAKYKNRGLVVLGVALDDDGWKPVRPYLAEKKINYPIVVGSPALAKQYGVEPMPMTYLIDRRGKVAATHIGMVDKENTEKEIVQMLSK
jgi:cytochrome c biogenesis protein CcmG/thiol:disulfide interchange protein DsbE